MERGQMVATGPAPEPLGLEGDADFVFTAPVICSDRVLQRSCEPWRFPEDGPPELVKYGGLDHLLRGTLTFEAPRLGGVLCQLDLGDDFRREVLDAVSASCGRRGVAFPRAATCRLDGLVFEDGIITVAVTLHVPDGWTSERALLEELLGPRGRDDVATAIRAVVLPRIRELVTHLDGDSAAVVDLPYFNLTYVGFADAGALGRATLDDALRTLLYPHSPEPLVSMSPRLEEFFYAGYAYSALVTAHGDTTCRDKLRSLLLVLNYQYVRLVRSIELAESRFDAARRGEIAREDAQLDLLELILTTDYRELAAPTFSFDYHALRLRDAYLRVWDVERLFERCQFLLRALNDYEHQRTSSVEAARARRLNRVVVVLTIVSVVSSIDAALDILGRV